MRRGLAYVLFLLSGATALCYEVAWTRRLVLVFGSTTAAVALILAAYMLGLALGAEAGELGNALRAFADQSQAPLVVADIAPRQHTEQRTAIEGRRRLPLASGAD